MLWTHSISVMHCPSLVCQVTWVMSILNALLTEKAVLYACVELVAFQQKYLIIICKESPDFPDLSPAYTIYLDSNSCLWAHKMRKTEVEVKLSRTERLRAWNVSCIICFWGVLFFCTAQECEKKISVDIKLINTDTSITTLLYLFYLKCIK